MNSDPSKDRSIPFTLFITTIIAYGLLLPQMGFYWDDWPFVWIARFLGPADFFPAFQHIRPFLSPIFFVTTSLIPPVPIYWQILALIVRFLSGLLAWSLLNQVWPQHKRQALTASFLFLLFPGYSQQWVAFTHVNQEWIAFLFYLLSFSLTAKALRNKDRFIPLTVWALISLVAGVFPTEYFVSSEPLRFLFILSILAQEYNGIRKQLLEAFKRWFPYLLVWLANAAWLAYFYTMGTYGSYNVEVVNQPMSFIQILSAIGEAIWKGGFYIWGQVIVLTAKTIRTPSSLLALVLIAISFIAFLFYLRSFKNSENNTNKLAVHMLVIGVVGIVLGRLPSFSAGLPLTLQSSNDRFMISMMLGGSLFIVGLVELLIWNPRFKLYAFAVLIALAVGQQFFNANIFRRDWQKQQDILWQMTWRIPAMKPNTLLMTNQLPLDYETDLSLTAPINWIYAPDYTRSAVPYGLVYTEKRLGGSLPSLAPGQEVRVQLRTVDFTGSTSQVIVIYMPKNGCLRVLGSRWGDEITYERASPFLVGAIPLSDPDLIDIYAAEPAKLSFLAEPRHTWCYYYTKAELARQQGDWNQVINLFDKASLLGYKPADPFELLVFVEAYARNGDINTAEQLSSHAMDADKRVRKGLCQVWQRVMNDTPMQMRADALKKHLWANIWCP